MSAASFGHLGRSRSATLRHISPADALPGRSKACRTLKRTEDLRTLPEVQKVVALIEAGGFPEAVVRMLVLLADARGNVRRDRLTRSTQVLTKDETFASMPAPDRATMIHEQSLIAQFEPEKAVAALPKPFETKADRELAAKVVQYILGAMGEMDPHILTKLQEFRKVFGLAKATSEGTDDPLADKPAPDDMGTAVE